MSGLSPAIVMEMWNRERLSDWPKAIAMPAKRQQLVRLRAREIPDLDKWQMAFKELKRNRWYEKGSWRPNLDWFLMPGKMLDLIERFDTRNHAGNSSKSTQPIEIEEVYRCFLCGSEETNVAPVRLMPKWEMIKPEWRGKLVCKACEEKE